MSWLKEEGSKKAENNEGYVNIEVDRPKRLLLDVSRKPEEKVFDFDGKAVKKHFFKCLNEEDLGKVLPATDYLYREIVKACVSFMSENKSFTHEVVDITIVKKKPARDKTIWLVVVHQIK